MKTTIEKPYHKGLFDIYANADKVSEDFLVTTRRGRLDLEKVIDVVQWFY